MIATGNHNFERFAALCNTLPGEAWALCAKCVPFNEPLSFVSFGRMLSAPTVRAGKLLPFGERLSFVSFGRILSAPTVWVGKLLPFNERLSCVHFGRLRASPTGGFYHATNGSVPSGFGRILSAPTVACTKLPRYRVPIPLSR